MRRFPTFIALLISTAMLGGELLASNDTKPASRAEESQITQSENRSSIDATLEARRAQEWGLQSDEWVRYRELMRGPLGIYSPNLDPLTALGIEARSDEERRRYAELQVRVEGRRAEKMLQYQRAYDEAWKRLYPALRPVRSSEAGSPKRTSNVVVTGEPGRLAVFVKENCSACDERVKQLQAAGWAFDLYMVGSRGDNTRIREWAAHGGIDPAKVRARTITLNHDGGRWLSIGIPGELPAVVRQVNGQWRRE